MPLIVQDALAQSQYLETASGSGTENDPFVMQHEEVNSDAVKTATEKVAGAVYAGDTTADIADPAVAILAERRDTDTSPATATGKLHRLLTTALGYLKVSVKESVAVVLAAGTNAIGKLAANDGVDIGDVTINNDAGSGVYVRPATGVNLDTANVTVTTVTRPTTPTSGQTTVGTSEVPLGNSAALKSGVNIMADPANSGEVYIGPTGLTTTSGFLLVKGVPFFVDIDDVDSTFCIASAPGQKVYFFGT